MDARWGVGLTHLEKDDVPEFIPFSRPTIEQEEIDEVVAALRSGWPATGPKVLEFEAAFSEYLEGRYCVAVNSGTAALHVALLALGIGPGHEVITSPITFIATVNVILFAGATPVLVDVENDSLNMNPRLIERAVTSNTRAVLPVHFSGLPCDMDSVMSIADDNGLAVVEDAAHAIGSEYKRRRIGTIGDVTCFSFHPTKTITTGEGGMLVTASHEVAQKARLLRFHGMDREAWKRFTSAGSPLYDVAFPGLKYNMMDLQAAIGLHQLTKLDRFIERRLALVDLYFAELDSVRALRLPPRGSEVSNHAWHIFPILVRTEELGVPRDTVVEELRKLNVGVGIHFTAVHSYSYYRFLDNGELSNADYASERIMSLPLYPTMSDSDLLYVARALKKIIARFS